MQGGTPYLGTSASAILFGELSSLRREQALLLEKDVRLQERANLLLSRAGDGNEDASASSDVESYKATYIRAYVAMANVILAPYCHHRHCCGLSTQSVSRPPFLTNGVCPLVRVTYI